jgi:hypothetical protein
VQFLARTNEKWKESKKKIQKYSLPEIPFQKTKMSDFAAPMSDHTSTKINTGQGHAPALSSISRKKGKEREKKKKHKHATQQKLKEKANQVMGAQLSNLVFQPLPAPTYDATLEGLFAIPREILDGSVSFDETKQPKIGEEGAIPAVFYEWKGMNGETAWFTVIYSGGIKEDLGTMVEWVKTLRDVLHVSTVIFSFSQRFLSFFFFFFFFSTHVLRCVRR